MAMASVVLVAAYRRIWGSDRSVWCKSRQPIGAPAALTKMNRVNSRSGSSLLRWQHH